MPSRTTPLQPETRRAELDRDALASLVAARAAASLQCDPVAPRARARLEAARARAMERARAVPVARRHAEPALAGPAPAGRGSAPRWQRALAWLPLLGLLAGLWLLGQSLQIEQARRAADIDALLLADDLPPQAWRDPGFAEFLRRPAGGDAP